MKAIRIIIGICALCMAQIAICTPIHAQENNNAEEYSVTCTAENPLDGSMWMGTNGDGLYRLGKNGSRLHFSAAGGKLGSDSIIYICFDSRNKLWITGSNGTITGYTSKDGFKNKAAISDEISRAIYLPKEDKILLASVTKSYAFNTVSEWVESEAILPFAPTNLKLSSDSTFVWIFGEEQVVKYNLGEVSDLIPLEFETYTAEEPSEGHIIWVMLACALAFILLCAVAYIFISRAKSSPLKPKNSVLEVTEADIVRESPKEVKSEEIFVPSEPEKEAEPVTKFEPKSTEFTTRIMLLVEDHFSEPDFDVDAIASILGISRIHVNRKLKAEGSPSPSTLIKEKRMDVAKYLLLNSEMPMTKIASECGFRSPSYFTTAFKDYTGLTPSEFIAQNRL